MHLATAAVEVERERTAIGEPKGKGLTPRQRTPVLRTVAESMAQAVAAGHKGRGPKTRTPRPSPRSPFLKCQASQSVER